MKLLLAIGLSVGFSIAAWAIPQTVGNNTAGFAARRSFEQIASDRATWAPSAYIPGAWSRPDADGGRKLTESTVVFGLIAAEVHAEQSSDRLTRLRVIFRDVGKERRTLFTRVSQGIEAFTGHPGHLEGRDAKVFNFGQTQICAVPSKEGEVVVEFTCIP